MSPVKKATKKTPAKAAGPKKATLEPIPITHHAVSCALAKAEAALNLFRLAEEHYDGEDFEFMSMICTDVIAEELVRAKAAYVKAVGNKPAPAAEAAR